MRMRELIDLVEATMLPFNDSPADRFISTAEQTIQAVHGDMPVRFTKTGPRSIAVNDHMQGIRTQAHWAMLRTLSGLARKYNIDMKVSSGAGRSPWR